MQLSAMPKHCLQRMQASRGHRCTRETKQQRFVAVQSPHLLPGPLPMPHSTKQHSSLSGLLLHSPSGNVQWNRECVPLHSHSSTSKALGDALLHQISSEIKSKFAPEPHGPNQARRWLSHLPGSNTIQLQSSLEQRQTPGQPGNKDKLWVIISRLVPHRSRGFAKSLPGSLVASPVQMTMAGEEEGGVVPV